MDSGLYEAAPYAWPRWCHGNIRRQVAEQRLLSNHSRNPFLIRQRDTGEFVMSIRWDTTGLCHSLIRKKPDGSLQMDGVPHAFADLHTVVTDYIQVHNNSITPIAADGSPVVEAFSQTMAPTPVPAMSPTAPPVPTPGFGGGAPSGFVTTPMAASALPRAYPVQQPQQAVSPWQLPRAMPIDSPPPRYPGYSG